MAKVKTKSSRPVFLTRLQDALVEQLGAVGIKARVGAEPVRGTKLFRVKVVAPKFRSIMHSERQNLVWRIAEKAIPKDSDQLRISMIITLADDEE